MVIDSTVERDLGRAAHRAFARDLSARLVTTRQFGHNGVEFYDVASFSEAGTFHRVRLDFAADGIDAVCDCIGNQHGKVCQHIAVALQASESLPIEEPKPQPKRRNLLLELQAEGEAIRREVYGHR